jgi:hypothetical protein
MPDLGEKMNGIREPANAAVWLAPDQVRVLGSRRRSRHRLAVAVAVAMGMVLVTLGATLPPTVLRPPQPVSVAPSTNARTGPVVAHQGAVQLPTPVAGHTQLMAYGAGSLWLAVMDPEHTHVPGTLLRVDPRTLTVISRWPIAAETTAVVVTDHFVWVAGQFNGDPLVWNGNLVQQFDLSGRVIHSYGLDSPSAMIGQGDSIWVVYGPFTNDLSYLHDGTTDPPLISRDGLYFGNLPHSGQEMVVCPDGLYVAAQGPNPLAQPPQTTVSRIVSGRLAALAHITWPATGLACAPGGGIFITEGDRWVRRLFLAGQTVGPYVAIPGGVMVPTVGMCDGGAWLEGRFNVNPTISFLPQDLKIEDAHVTVPGALLASAMDGCTLFLATANLDEPQTATMIITEITP